MELKFRNYSYTAQRTTISHKHNSLFLAMLGNIPDLGISSSESLYLLGHDSFFFFFFPRAKINDNETTLEKSLGQFSNGIHKKFNYEPSLVCVTIF